MASSSSFFLKGSKMMIGCMVVPSIPISIWYASALQHRSKVEEEVRTKVRIPNVQTIDELMVEKCQPGDILLFHRRWYHCASGPLAALSCLFSQTFLCPTQQQQQQKLQLEGNYNLFDHMGIVISNPNKNKDDDDDLYLLEATASSGIVARPLLTRLEMSQSKSVLLVPLTCPGERRTGNMDDMEEQSSKTLKIQHHFQDRLQQFATKWIQQSQEQGYANHHAMLGILGALAYAFHLTKSSPAPISPSAWLVVNALQESGAAMNLSERTSLETKVQDVLRDYRFHETDTIRLRPGWKFLSPVILRETTTSRS